MKKKPAALRELKKLSAIPFTDENYRAIVDSLKSESDRSMVVIAGSILEDELQSRIQRTLIQLDKEDSQRFFGFDGLAGTFSSKILMAYSLGLIDSHTRYLLDIVREVRNACAHSRMPVNFDTPELKNATVLLLPESLRKKSNRDQLRAQFLTVTSMLLTIIARGKSESEEAKVRSIIDRVFSRANTGS
ncbi:MULTISPECIES: hypothetical protein [unclassified Rhizobium]|uniref:hypothetical protein n=1 Tax=unclassified Rhizobium TaxID=2613769 RepID=UPI000EA9EAEA|nr:MULTISPECIES: hypothetical protein [unclassified Rhizobium]AYG71004.1 hypothetical protein CCGE531_34055 [Rhizobium sp. CCGE531]AYG77312.1 hypothetical protein CCGE532_33195 [Rhizobium sp. CCGE532]